MDEKMMQILEAAGWQPDVEMVEMVHYHNSAHCGDPTSIGDKDVEVVKVAKALVKYGATFSLVARGDSMTGVGISDGDVLVVRQQSVAEHGDIVIVMVNGDEVMVKNYIEDERGTVWFVPSNERYPALCSEDFDSVTIIGKVMCIQHNTPRASQRACMQSIMDAKKLRGRGGEVSTSRLSKALRAAKSLITTNRHWFAIYRSMVDERIINEGEFSEFDYKLKEALDDEAPELDLKDIRSMAVDSFSKPVVLWDPDNAPVRGARFYKYLEVAQTFKRSL